MLLLACIIIIIIIVRFFFESRIESEQNIIEQENPFIWILKTFPFLFYISNSKSQAEEHMIQVQFIGQILLTKLNEIFYKTWFSLFSLIDYYYSQLIDVQLESIRELNYIIWATNYVFSLSHSNCGKFCEWKMKLLYRKVWIYIFALGYFKVWYIKQEEKRIILCFLNDRFLL